jgi:hypothetical protein
MDDSDAFSLHYSTKVSFFDCHRRFLPWSHEFSGDKQSFLKDKTVRKGPPKQKFGADIMKIFESASRPLVDFGVLNNNLIK